ncbi:OmpA family protein [Geoalkalibacter halelectricus]|uniref:OmpA family protein n=1 Tax=Geoalkalibacter halelectricus TaxID=2847045 RepID=UPI003D1BB9AE
MRLFILAAVVVALVPRPVLAESICRELHAPAFEPVAKSLSAPSFLITSECPPGRLTAPNQGEDFALRLGAPTFEPHTTLSPQLPPCPIIPLTVLFDFDGVEPRAKDLARLDQIPAGCAVWIEGHACDLGSDVYNLELSQRRAAAVAGYLRARGVSVVRQQALGAALPAGPERAANRRVFVGPAPGAKAIREPGKVMEGP